MFHCHHLLAVSIHGLSVFFCLWGEKIQKVLSSLELSYAEYFGHCSSKMQVFYLLLLISIIEYQSAPWIALRNCLVLWITCKHSWGILGSILVVILLLIWTYILPSVLDGVQLWLFSFFSVYVLWSSGIFLKVLQSGRNIFSSLQRFFILKNPSNLAWIHSDKLEHSVKGSCWHCHPAVNFSEVIYLATLQMASDSNCYVWPKEAMILVLNKP